MNQLTRANRNWLSILQLPLLVFLGVIAGMLVGYRLLYPDKQVQATPTGEAALPAAASYLTFQNGSLFPPEEWGITVAGDSVLLSDLLLNQRTVVFLASFGCEPCQAMLATFKRMRVSDRLLAGIRVLVLVNNREKVIPAEYVGLVNQSTVLFIDERHWKNVFHHVLSPTVMTVDGSSFVQYQQFGWEGYFEKGIVDFAFSGQ